MQALAVIPWAALTLFALVSSITPGPNNVMLLASGANFGLRRTVPHILGVTLGFAFMLLAVGLGLAQAFQRLPWLHTTLKWVGGAYMLYLAFRIATSKPPVQDEAQPSSKPMSFLAAAAFQWVNPKAWMMGIGAFSTYVPASTGALGVAAAAGLFGLINLPCVGLWAVFGASLRHVLQVPRNLRLFNWTMAALLVLSLYPLLKG